MRSGAGGRGRICFFAPFAWPLFTEGRLAFTGGAEVQQVALARGLATLGFDVAMVCCDYGQPARVEVHGITVLRAYAREAGVPIVRFFHPRLSRTLAGLAAADADVYYVRGASLEAGITCDLAHSRRAAFVLGAAHDHDARRSLPLLGNPRDRWWVRRAIRGADAVVAQTETQRRLFASEHSVASEVIPNLVEVPERMADAGADGPVVWLATYKPAKRPEWFVELARRMPGRRFVMRGVIPIPPESKASWEAAQAAPRELRNLDVGGYVDHGRIGELLGSAALMVHTSPVEGFPNTVLEAWAHGVPTVTAVDPDGVVGRERLGAVTDSQDGLAAAVEALMSDPAARRENGRRARAWVAANHAPARVLDRLAALFDRMVAKARAARGG